MIAFLTIPCGGTISNVKASVSENTWQEMMPMITERGHLGVTSADGKIYAIGGGSSGANILNTNEVYDPATNTWSTNQPIPTARSLFGMAVLKAKFICIGGFGKLGNLWRESQQMRFIIPPLILGQHLRLCQHHDAVWQLVQ
jgi:hypothetical protein